jgi:hypothetical protein
MFDGANYNDGSQLQFFAKDVTRQEASKDLELLFIS